MITIIYVFLINDRVFVVIILRVVVLWLCFFPFSTLGEKEVGWRLGVLLHIKIHYTLFFHFFKFKFITY